MLPPLFERALAVGAAMSTYVSLYAAFSGFLELARGRTIDEVARATGYGAAVAFPSAVLVGLAAALYLLLEAP